jgi:glutathione S-transferase
MKDERILVYSMAVCPFAQRTEIVLRHKNLPYEAISIDISKPRPPELLAVNPLGKVPVLIHRGKALNESSVINEYLEDVCPQPSLFPLDPWEKAQTRLLIDFCNTRFVPNQYKLLMEQNAERRPKAAQAVSDDWAWVDAFLRRLNPNGELLWDSFSMADATFAPFFQRFVLNEYFWRFAIPESDEFARVRRWRAALAAHPLVQATSLTSDDYVKLYADYALGYGNGKVPEGRNGSSFDLSIPLADRPMPERRV